jgi:hypothetical protein
MSPTKLLDKIAGHPCEVSPRDATVAKSQAAEPERGAEHNEAQISD